MQLQCVHMESGSFGESENKIIVLSFVIFHCNLTHRITARTWMEWVRMCRSPYQSVAIGFPFSNRWDG